MHGLFCVYLFTFIISRAISYIDYSNMTVCMIMPCIHCCSSSVVWMSMCVPQDLGFVLETGSLLEGTGTIGIRVIRPKSINRCAVVFGIESRFFQSTVLLPQCQSGWQQVELLYQRTRLFHWLASARGGSPKKKAMNVISK